MDKIEVNKDAQEKMVNETATSLIKQITRNAEGGNPCTDLYIPKHLHYAVRDRLEEMLKVSNTKFTWLVVKRGNNQYTGRPESYHSETIDDEVRRRIYIL
jgi:hypothetical protein